MTDNQNPKNSPSSSSNSRVPTETNHNGTAADSASAQKHRYPNPPEIGYKGSSNAHKHPHYPNPPDPINPDPATLRGQWKYATRQYSRWYSQAWGSAILAGLAFFALGWIVKGSNPLPSLGGETTKKQQQQQQRLQEEEGHDVPSPPVPPTLTSKPRDAVDTPKS